MSKYLKIFSILFSVLLLVFIVIPVFAEDSTTNTTEVSPTKSLRPGILMKQENIKERIQSAKERNLEIKENLKERASEAAQRRAEKLSEARLKMCEARKKGIAQRVKFMLNRGLIIHKGHERAYTLADKFYTEKLVPAGYTLSNYADLKAEVEANKANVQALLDAAKASGSDFDCSADDPKGQLDAFKEDVQNLIEANKAYKTAVHNFVKAIRDLAKTARLDKLSTSPSPTATEAAQ